MACESVNVKRSSYMSAHVLLNSLNSLNYLNEFWKEMKCEACQTFY